MIEIEKTIESRKPAARGAQDLRVLRHSLVTGASGCVGRAIVKELLNAGIRVNALVRDPGSMVAALGSLSEHPRLRVMSGDLANSDELRISLEGVDSVFHAAAKVHAIPRSIAGESEFYQVNVEGTRNLLMAIKARPVRAFVFFSTIAVYGRQPHETLTEETPARPDTPYGRSKYDGEKLVMDVLSETDVSPIILRLPLVCGPGDRGNLMRMIRAIDRRRFLLLDGGKAKKSIVFSKDVAAVAAKAASLSALAGETFLIANPEPFEVRRIAEAAATELERRLPRISLSAVHVAAILDALGKGFALLGYDFPVKAEDIRTLASDRICDVSKMTLKLGYVSGLDLSTGIREAVLWYKNSGSTVL